MCDTQTPVEIPTDPDGGAYSSGNVHTITSPEAPTAGIPPGLANLLCLRTADRDDLANTTISGEEFSTGLACMYDSS